jgi:ubiquinone/menaquinone biosynthesis C-methylase UbiE
MESQAARMERLRKSMGPNLNSEISRVRSFYENCPETNRLGGSTGKLEFERSKEIISRFLRDPIEILDVGGGTGAYSFWLASLGHKVTLIDVSAVHVGIARETNQTHSAKLVDIIEGSALDLPFGEKRFDAILNMGPMYHLPPDARQTALSEMYRVLRPKGVMVSSYISRFASLIDGYNEGYVHDPAYLPFALGAISNGRHDPPADGKYFTLAYMHRPEEVEPEIEKAGFFLLGLYAVEGFFWAHPKIDSYIENEMEFRRLMEHIRLLEKEPSIMGSSAHFLAVSRVNR